MKNLEQLLANFSYTIKNFEDTLEDLKKIKENKKMYMEANEHYLYERLVFGHLNMLDEIKLTQDSIINHLNS